MATLQRLGMVNERLVAVHMTQMTDEEIVVMAAGKVPPPRPACLAVVPPCRQPAHPCCQPAHHPVVPPCRLPTSAACLPASKVTPAARWAATGLPLPSGCHWALGLG